ncbi:hypothetical protein [Lentzea flava]|uniref:Uncharacterized protein n=1 Tax=Lentzea flava TaxID=103732 RepID=A0ABQ2VI26_9PSEU|nr:hypothetical protein [Lentzea flava]MCP2205462.1 hypothetical protein [Lentzea flava]GGU87435.1 hypothetical protein GCM10010178_91540 [Lentzea flava]
MARNRNTSVAANDVAAPDILVGITGTLHKDPPPIYRELAQLLGDPTADPDDRDATTTADR